MGLAECRECLRNELAETKAELAQTKADLQGVQNSMVAVETTYQNMLLEAQEALAHMRLERDLSAMELKRHRNHLCRCKGCQEDL
jgi:multidrug resistance efflux pump